MPLKVHFLNVNRGDCSIIEFPSGHVGMIDVCDVGYLDETTREELLEGLSIGERAALTLVENRLALEEKYARRVAAGTTDPIDYLTQNVGRNVFRLIVTHPHMDHLSGLARLDGAADIGNFWHCGPDDFDLGIEDWSKSPYREEDWSYYCAYRNSSHNPKALVNLRDYTGDYWTDDGVEIWAPTPALVQRAVEKKDQNILSLVLRITYQGWSFVFGGDADATESWPDIHASLNLEAPYRNVLKASHHGRNSGYYQPAVKEMSPWLTVTSVGQKQHDATTKYRRYSDYTVSLRFSGTFSLTVSDDGSLTYPRSLENHWLPMIT